MKPFTLKSLKLGGQFTPEYYYNEWGAGGNNLSPDLYWWPGTPGSGFHPYVITVHALKEPLALKADANPALVGFQMSIVTLAKASVVAYVHV